MSCAPAARLEALQRARLRAHRLDPPRPVRTARAAAAFVRESGMVTTTGRSALPVLADAIAGRELRGSWMASPDVYEIHRVLVGLGRFGLPAAPLILGKETLFVPALGPAVQRVASDPGRVERARRALPAPARRLLERVEAGGTVRMDVLGLPAARSRPLRLRLERALLVAGRDVHTAGGYHTALVQPWADGPIAARFAHLARRLSYEEAVETLMLAALRSVVVAPEAEARRWFVFGGEAIDALLRRGVLVRLLQGRRGWLALEEAGAR